jgi:hypothetical protein
MDAPVPLSVSIGGFLLSVARFFNAPHVFLCEKLVAWADRRQLLRLAEMLAAG